MSKLKILIIQIAIIIPSLSHASNFFEQQYRGWLWFEEKSYDLLKKEDMTSHIPTKGEMESAKLENEQFKEELENLRHMIVRHPDNLNYIRLYKEKEKQMLDGAMVLARNFAMVNFLNPDIADQLKTPQNIYARNVAREQKGLKDEQTLKLLTDKIELFVFREGNCPHCPFLEKHLHSFTKKYGFKVEAVSQDGSTSSYFKTHHNDALIKKLALTVIPTVIAVTKDSSLRFELARGAVSIPDLEDKALLLAKYLQKHQYKTKIEVTQ